MITLSLPPTDNHIYLQKGKMKFMCREAKDWKEQAQWEFKSQYKGKLQTGDVEIGKIIFYLKHWRDIQGSLKLIFDAAEEIVYNNDRQVVMFGPVIRKTDKENPRVEIEIVNY